MRAILVALLALGGLAAVPSTADAGYYYRSGPGFYRPPGAYYRPPGYYAPPAYYPPAYYPPAFVAPRPPGVGFGVVIR
jgi:hypothetical protein